jgi:predicted regulator of Ras-like GTPase activity (Roadblock/LC7/MglB family)
VKARASTDAPRRRVGKVARVARDQHESAFASILRELIARVPGARAAALVDRDGETVDYAGCQNPHELKVAAAHLRIVLDQALSQRLLSQAFGQPRRLVVRAARASFVVEALPESYALVLCMARGAGSRGLSRSILVCAHRLAHEAGWHARISPWHPVEVLLDGRGAPAALRLGERRSPLEVLGRFRTVLPENERAWRVRTLLGVEFTLVREVGGFWYMDALVAE